ncbi:hypothetical protein B0H13DRAFT_2325948 [Mycena leptocephala]|nr:hypothetical protein B0H13DRAFT_2325948 [Mycena leptocephala]
MSEPYRMKGQRGMFSRPDHHHKNGAATLQTAPLQPTSLFGPLGVQDAILLHHQHHLQTLLDSALATAILIQESASQTGGHIPYSQHVLGVCHLLSCRINPKPTTVVTPAPLPTPPTTQPDTSAHATPHPRPLLLAPLDSQPRRDPLASLFALTMSRILYPGPYNATPRRCIEQFDETSHEKQLLAGVQWTKGGNIALHPAAETCTAKFLVGHSDLIWLSIRRLLGFTEDRKCPVFDTDGPWHSVVFHGVPMPHPPTDAIEFLPDTANR